MTYSKMIEWLSAYPKDAKVKSWRLIISDAPEHSTIGRVQNGITVEKFLELLKAIPEYALGYEIVTWNIKWA